MTNTIQQIDDLLYSAAASYAVEVPQDMSLQWFKEKLVYSMMQRNFTFEFPIPTRGVYGSQNIPFNLEMSDLVSNQFDLATGQRQKTRHIGSLVRAYVDI